MGMRWRNKGNRGEREALFHEYLFVGRFNVTKVAREDVLLDESGAATIREAARRIASSESQRGGTSCLARVSPPLGLPTPRPEG